MITTGYLIYNFIAFALQVPIGYLADQSKISNTYFAIFGTIAVALGVAFPYFAWVKLIMCALGNAFFHIGGGIDSLINANGRYARSGIFISFGAIGVTIGTLTGKHNLLPAWFLITILIICAALQLMYCKADNRSKVARFNLKPAIINRADIVIYICMISIIIRALVGSYTPITWRTSYILTLLPTLCVFVGKFSGGLLADKFGAKNVTVISLVIAAPLLAFYNSNIILCCIGLLLFNITTSITLCIIVSKLPNNPGLGFGLTTLALFIGTAFCFFFIMSSSLRPILLITFTIISAISIYLTASNRFKKFEEEL